MLPTKFRFIWPGKFQRRRFLEIDQSAKQNEMWATQAQLTEPLVFFVVVFLFVFFVFVFVFIKVDI
jgi:hypothetical protein